MKNKKSRKPIGSTTTGIKLGFLLGLIVSTIFNVSSIGVLLESIVEWAGVFQSVVEFYKVFVVEPFSIFITEILKYLGFDVSPPRLLATYYSLTAGLSLTYVCLTKLLGRDVNTGDFYAAVALMSPFSLIRSQIFNESETSATSVILILLAIPVYVGAAFPFLVLVLTVFPFFLLYQSVLSIFMYFRFDFSRIPSNPEESEFIERALEIYDRTVKFWFVVLSTLLLSGFFVLLNNELEKKCTENLPAFELLCSSHQSHTP